MNCLNQTNPFGGFASDHGVKCSLRTNHTDGEILINADATHHVAIGNPIRSCRNICGKCAKRYASRKDAVVTEGASIDA